MKRHTTLGRGLLLAALLLSLLAGLGSQPTHAAGGLIAYIGSDANVYLVDQDGSNRRQILGDGGYYDLSWSPDGATLAGQRATSDHQLALYSPNSGKTTWVTTDVRPQHITWAGSGNALAFDNNGTRKDNASSSAIYVVNTDGSGLRRVVNGYAPSWSPDIYHPTLFYLAPPYVDVGGRCDYSEGGGVPSLLYLDSGQSVALFGKAVPFGVAHPVWSPDGQTIGYGLHFWRRSDGKGTATIPPGTIMSWSPNGQLIAWTDTVDGRDDTYYGVQLHVLDRSTNTDRILFTAKRKSTQPGCSAIDVLWSETSGRMAFADVDLNDVHGIFYSDNAAKLQTHQLGTEELGFGTSRRLYDMNPSGSALLVGNPAQTTFFVYDISSGTGGKLGDGHAAQWQPRRYERPTPPVRLTPTPAPTVQPPYSNPPEPNADPNSVPLAIPHSSPYFTIWQRDDYPLYYGQVQRSWMWGPTVDAALAEPYAEGQDGKREVVYFDKGRMEINNPAADPSSPWYVTSGLLVAEMVGGYIQVGNTATQPHTSNSRAVAGDGQANQAPSYAAFAPLLASAHDRTGQAVNATIDKQGHVGSNPGLANLTSNAVYVAATGHNIPTVFWQFLNQHGLVYDGTNYRNDLLFDWVYAMGYPISEAYWSNITIRGQPHYALIQLYQRRTLTYVPDLAAGWQVQMGNVGLDYLDWRH